MAYLHCHTKDCGWAQDDFWELFHINRWEKRWWKKIRLGYNPIWKMWNDIKWLWKPRMIELESWLVDDLQSRSHIPVYKKIHGNQYLMFSWNWLLFEFFKEIRIIRRQKWWTWKSWKKARDTAVCPKCGLRDFDID